MIVSKGRRRYPAVIPAVVNAADLDGARLIADRIGRRFFGSRYLGAFVPAT